MDKAAQCFTTQMIQGDGTLNANALEDFIERSKLKEYGCSYAIVSVMGPQSSGKSTLLNHLFHTDFEVMDASKTRSRTTKGVWIARFTGDEPCTIVMDIEGTDGQERGEDDTAFERQSALFAIAISDIVIINMWCHDIGREKAANIPLMKNVFQVMLQILKPRKITLMFVLRDKTKTPAAILESKLREVIKKMWDSIPKPEVHKGTPLSKFLNVEVVFLSSYEYDEEQFKDEVASLRQELFQSIEPSVIAGDKRWVVPASGFSFKAQDIWKRIKENEDLNLPSYTILVANVRCENIAWEKYSSFVENYKDWTQLGEDEKSHIKKLSLLLDNCLSDYDKEVMYFNANVASAKRRQLEEKLMQNVQPAYKRMYKHIRYEVLGNFNETLNDALNKGQGFEAATHICTKMSMGQFNELYEDATTKKANWDSTKIRNKFHHDLDEHITKVRAIRLDELTTLYESKIKKALCSHMEHLFEGGRDDLWLAIRTCLNDETEMATSMFSFELSRFEMDEEKKEDMILKLKNFARRQVKKEAKIEAGKVLGRMKDRFKVRFSQDNNSLPRLRWTGDDDIPAITKIALTSCLRLLSLFAVIHLDEDKTDTIWKTLQSLVEERTYTTTSHDLLALSTWEKIPAADTLLTPIQCKALWDDFKRETTYIINIAKFSQQAYLRKVKSANHWDALNKNFDVVMGIVPPLALLFPHGHGVIGAALLVAAFGKMVINTQKDTTQDDIKK